MVVITEEIIRDAIFSLSTENVSSTDIRVLLLLMKEMDENGNVYIFQRDIAKTIKKHPSTISRSLKKLEEIGVIYRKKKEGMCFLSFSLEFFMKRKKRSGSKKVVHLPIFFKEEAQ